ncbi:MAG TPA: copper resistance CopC family protein, partial [Kofleriaceae bacterium]|nr:copper resistance CopC family protein [Kofleriaceae bacterium]
MIRALAAGLVLLALAPAAASAHARLEGTSPERGTTVAKEPARVVFRFGERVEATFGAVRVFDARGTRVDNGRIVRPGGDDRQVGTALQRGLPRGTYTATYRVVSADGHPVSGGFTFSIGRAGAAPRESVADLVGGAGSGTATDVAFGAVKALGYVAIALALGGLAFLAAVWRPALAGVAGGGAEWARAAGGFAGRARRLLAAAVVLGLVTSAAGLVLEGATGAGVSFWSALDPTIVREAASTHAGTGWVLRLADWALLAVALGLLAGRGAIPVARPVPLGATGHVLDPALSRAALVALAVPALFLAVAPALSGHASTQDPVWALFPLDVAHVLAMSAWLGGLALLLICVPAATRS